MIDYRVRSISLLNLVTDVKNGKLIPDAFFQRNLVWRDIHNKDFIKTILLGLPFPQIFISKGKVDIISMSTVSCIVDGQQRTNAIMKYIDNEFEVDGKCFSNLTDEEKSNFLKYEVAIIELDLENNDPKVKEIFQRINRTSNSLSIIEKLASEYSTSEYMLVAKLLADQIEINLDENDIQDGFKEDPNISNEFYTWANKKKVANFQNLITQKGVFSVRDITRKVHLMHVLNIMSTILSGFFNRNEKTMMFLNDYSFLFDDKDEITNTLETTAIFIKSLKIKNKSIWYSKSNLFSLIIALANKKEVLDQINSTIFKSKLEEFEQNIHPDFKLATTEGVNNKKEREIRNKFIISMIDDSLV